LYRAHVSRKVYLHTQYTNFLLRHPVLLFCNVFSADFRTLLNLRIALAAHNARIKVIRRRIFISALRVAEYIESTRTGLYDMWDPSGLAMHAKILPRKRNTEEFEMTTLLRGSQTCAVYFDEFNWKPESIDLAKIATVTRIIERTGKTPILGGRFQRTVITAADVKRLRTVPDVSRGRQELVGALGGAAQTLAGTLSAPAAAVAWTLEGRQKAMEEEQGTTESA
jgi:ribosomal protein L10